MAKSKKSPRNTPATGAHRPAKRAALAKRVAPKEPKPANEPAKSSTGFPVVGIGSSAGGLEALEALFKAMPVDTGMAFVVVSHLHPGHTSLLPELLGRATSLPVVEAKDDTRVRPNHVYVAAPGGRLTIVNATLHRIPVEDHEPDLPIDHFLRSLAADQKEKAICIILSGTGSDGTIGLREIKAELGMSMVQQVESAKYSGMPGSAIATGLADFVLPPQEMPRRLIAYVKGPYLTAPPREEPLPQDAEPLPRIFALIRARTGHDFSGYKASTIRRRIDRRMNLHQVGTAGAYVHYLEENPHEIDILFRELLISVTSFFRDAEAFASLAEALQKLLESRPEKHTLRVWAPGCATGEEIYSLAIVACECMEAMGHNSDAQIFGTDLDSEAIDVARAALYPEAIAPDVSKERLRRFFTQDGNMYRIRKDVRDMTVFAVQNVVKDAPFTRLDLLCCRNLLIYLNAEVQKRLLPLFHYSLRPGGLLFLGPSETVGNFTDLFEPVDKRWKIYRRREGSQSIHPVLDFSAGSWRNNRESRQTEFSAPPRDTNIAGSVERLLISRFAPASVLVNDRGDALYFHGRTGLYLEPSAGKPRLNVVDMAREGLQLELSAALRQVAAKDAGEVTREAVRVKTNGDFTRIDLKVTRIQEPENLRSLFLVTFVPVNKPPEPAPRVRGKKETTGTVALERELQSTKESLKTSIEELQTSNEELKSTNEELQSTNEELQSANEEMETSKEEMQSLNEELSTVNAELQSKVDELSRANDDMQNLLNSIEIATIFLDGQLKITRYTEQATRLVSLIQTDVGRPLADLVSNLNYDTMVADCREVLRTLASRQIEVQTKTGQWFLVRIMPYRTADNVIDGVVLTFVDIDPLKQAQKSLRHLLKMFAEGLDPVVVVDLQGRIADLNDEVVRAYGWTREDLLGQPVTMMVPPSDGKKLEEALERARQGQTIRGIEWRRLDKAGHEHKGLLTVSPLTDERGAADAISVTVQPVSD